MIADIVIKPLEKKCNELGCVFKMIRSDDNLFSKFGEIYFSSVNPGKIKGWTMHTKMDINLACVSGQVKCVVYDNRANSATYKQSSEIFLGDDNYQLVHVPAGIAVSFMGLGRKEALIANLATMPHNPEEMVKFEPSSPQIDYRWLA